MLQDAINALASIQNQFQEEIYGIEIYPNGESCIFLMDAKHQDFKNAQEMLEWMETNLTKVNQ